MTFVHIRGRHSDFVCCFDVALVGGCSYYRIINGAGDGWWAVAMACPLPIALGAYLVAKT